MRTYRELFAVAEFRTIFASQCLTVASTAVGGLALATITYDATGNAIASGLAISGGPLIRLVGSWFLVSASDVLRPRTALGLTAGVGLVADLLQSAPAFVLGRATLNIAVGGMQIVGYGLAGVLLAHLTTTDLFLCAAAASAGALALVVLGVRDHPARAPGPGPVPRARSVNRALLTAPHLRPVLLASWVPNGLIVGCESLFVPLAGRHAGYLYAAAAAGMLTGDILVGRFAPHRLRDRALEPLRMLLAAPYLVVLLHPGLGVLTVSVGVASVGYAASLPLQERLVTHTPAHMRGQVLGLNGSGQLAGQGVGAVLAGGLAQLFGAGAHAAGTAVGVVAVASLAVTVALVPGLRRTA